MRSGDSNPDTSGVSPGTRAGILRFQSLRPGALFAGRFEIRETLGGGGGGEVFRAHDRLLSQDVAIKVLFPGTSDRDISRLRREVRSARSLQHPNILRVHDLGEHDGLFYIVSEVLEGETLAQRLAREGRIPPSDAEYVLRCILEALACAHEASIIHRDVKPANVFLAAAEDPVRPRVVLLDFGLARPINGATVTLAGHFVGTPEYCAPEQIRGDRSLGPATDLYGCGVTLWEMLAGAPPYSGDSDVETLRQHLEDSIPRPAAALAGAPLNLQSLAVDLLQKDPARRPADAREALRRLDRRTWLGTRLRIAWRARTRPAAVRWKIARRVAVALLAVAALAWAVIYLITPTAVRAERHHLVWQTRLGFSWEGSSWTQELRGAVLYRSPLQLLPITIVAANTYDDLHGRVLLEDGSPAPAMYRVDYVGLRTSPYWTDPTSERGLLGPSSYPFASAIYRAGRLVLTRPPTSASDETLALILENVPNYPSRVVEVVEQGMVLRYEHPGRLYGAVLASGGDARPDLLLLGSVNNLLGPREAVFALRSREGGAGQAPPYTGSVKFKDICQWYLPLRFDLRQEVALRVSGDRAVATLGDGGRVEFDLDHGVPLDPAVRGGLTREDWIARRDGLMKSLFEAAALAESGAAEQGAHVLEEFAREAAGPPWAVSIPAYRAAILRMKASRKPGDLGPALADIERAVATEPEPPRYGLLQAEILARMGRAPEARDLLRSWWTRPAQEYYSFEWLLLRWLAGEEVPTETALAPSATSHTCGGWPLTIANASNLRSGRPESVLSRVQSLLDPALCWQSQWYLGARAAMAVRPQTRERVMELLDRADKGLLTGYPVPLRLARLRTKLEADPRYRPTSEEIDGALTDFSQLVEYSRFNLEALYLLNFAIEDAERFRGSGAAPAALSPLIDEARVMLAPVGDRWGPRLGQPR